MAIFAKHSFASGDDVNWNRTRKRTIAHKCTQYRRLCRKGWRIERRKGGGVVGEKNLE